MNTSSHGPKISIIIPVYNTEAYLEACLQSVSVQTLADFEVFCIDDASTDNSTSIIDLFVQEDDRFHKLTNDYNSGAGMARNRGIEAACGEYIAFLDSDDTIKSDTFEKTYAHCKKTKADICCYPLSLAYPSKNEISEFPFSLDFSLLPDNINEPFPCSIAENGAFMFTNPSVCTKLFRRDFLNGIEARFTSFRVAEDLLFTYSAFVQTERIAVMHEYFYAYNQEKATSISKEGGNMTALIKTMDLLAEKLTSLKIYDRYKDALANLFLYHSGGTLTLIHDEASLQSAFAICHTWKERLQEIDIHFLYPHYKETYQQLCFGTPTSYLLNTVKNCMDALGQYELRVKKLEEDKDALLTKKAKLSKENELLHQKLEQIMHSKSFRLGTTLLYVPSRIKGKLKK